MTRYESAKEQYAKWGVDFIKCDDIAVTEFRQWDTPYSAYYEIEMIRKKVFNEKLIDDVINYYEKV